MSEWERKREREEWMSEREREEWMSEWESKRERERESVWERVREGGYIRAKI